jgi:nucleotide-binding universal stress UspA family protein
MFILVPIDDSWVAQAVLPYAELLARTLDAEIRLLSITSERSDTPNLEAIAAELRPRGARVSTALLHGDAAQQILAAAEQEDVELVIMATHGRGGLERWLVGSVADTVMRACSRPILLIVPSDFAEPAPAELYRILLPLDGSALAEAALPLAVRLATASGAALTLARVVEPSAASMTPVEHAPDLDALERAETENALHYLEGVRSRLSGEIASDALVLRGLGIARTLASYVQSAGIDLVVMSSRGLGGFRRLVVGSTADQLIRSAVPTLLVHLIEPFQQQEARAGQEQAVSD